MNSKPMQVNEQLDYLKLRFMQEQYRALADEAAKKSWNHQQYFRLGRMSGRGNLLVLYCSY